VGYTRKQCGETMGIIVITQCGANFEIGEFLMALLEEWLIILVQECPKIEVWSGITWVKE
jgi:hypothetical protein